MQLLFFMFGQLFWSDMYFGMAPRLDSGRVSCVSKRLDMCSKCDDQSKFNNQLNWEDSLLWSCDETE